MAWYLVGTYIGFWKLAFYFNNHPYLQAYLYLLSNALAIKNKLNVSSNIYTKTFIPLRNDLDYIIVVIYYYYKL